MNVALWICAGLLSAVLLLAGIGKLVVPKQKLSQMPGATWTKTVSVGFVTFLGVVEVAGAAGLILPAVTGIAPILVPVAAVGVVVLMAGAAVTHGRLREPAGVATNLAYLALAAFVAWGRFWVEPFGG